MSDSVRPHRRQPTRLPRPWDSPGKNTGVGCHFLLQCRKVKSESEVTQSCPTLSDPMDYSPPGSSVHGTFQARALEWGAITLNISILISLWSAVELQFIAQYPACHLTSLNMTDTLHSLSLNFHHHLVQKIVVQVDHPMLLHLWTRDINVIITILFL